MKTPKPTATINIPVRFVGRRVQPISPARMNDQLTNSPSAIAMAGCASWSLAAMIATAIPPATSAAGPK